MKVNSIAELRSYIEKQIQDTLSKDVAKKVKGALIASAEENIYNTDPTMYVHRGSLKEYDVYVEGMRLSVETFSTPNLSYVSTADASFTATIVQQGASNPFNDRTEYSWMKPRPFIHMATEELEWNNEPRASLRSGLRARGLKVK